MWLAGTERRSDFGTEESERRRDPRFGGCFSAGIKVGLTAVAEATSAAHDCGVSRRGGPTADGTILVSELIPMKGPESKPLRKKHYYLANARNSEYQRLTEVTLPLNCLPAPV